MNYLIEPWAHQKKAIEVASQRDNYALFFEMGTGKTLTAINIYRYWCLQEGRILPTLILCPPIVIKQWQEEVAKNSKVGHLTVALEGTGKKRAQLLEKHLAESSPRIYITNYETLLMPPVFALLCRAGLEVLICDESQKLKNHTAKRTKQVHKLSTNIRRKLIMTGSPVLNSPMDLFSQYRILDGGSTFGRSFMHFRAKYFYDLNVGMPKASYFPDWQPRPGAFEEFNAAVRATSMVVKKSECLDLPPLVKTVVNVEMNPEQKRVYKEIKNELVAYLESGIASADIALTKVLRMQQIVSGFINVVEISEDNVENKKTHSFGRVPRLVVTKEILEQITPNNKVIIWCSFIQNYEELRAICGELGIEYCEIHGQKSAKQKQTAVEEFRNNDKVRVCIAHPKAGGVGLNLVEAAYSLYYSRGYSLEDDMQSEARNYRGGSEIHTKITRIDLVTPGSVDEEILKALRNKESIAKKVLDMKNNL